MKPTSITIEYATLEGSSKFFSAAVTDEKGKFGDQNLSVEYVYKACRFTLAVNPLNPEVILKNAFISGELETKCRRKTRYLVNGYQSWTDTREYSRNEKEKGVGYMPAFINKKFAFPSYGDYTFCGQKLKKGAFHGWTYSYVKLKDQLEFAGSLLELGAEKADPVELDCKAEKSRAFALMRLYAKERYFEIFADGDGINLSLSKPLVLLDVLFISGPESEVFDSYFENAGIPKPSAKPVLGWTSWYDFYQNINEECLMKNLEAMEEPFQVFQIDDGYEPYVGDWLEVDKKKFPNGLEPVTKKAKEKGMKTGIWFAPFSAEKKSALVKNHPDWLCKNEKGKPVLCGCNWSGFYALDIYNDEAREYIKQCCRHFIDDLGFTLLKIDFLYSVCLVPRKDKTRGQVMYDAMNFFRQVSEGAELLGCGVPLGSAFGLVEYCRIGTDVSLNWDDKPYMRLCHRERPSTKYTIMNSLYRRQLDNRAFLNDPDVFLLRSYNEKLGQERKSLLSRINSLAGSLVFTSDNPSTYDDWQQFELQGVIKRMDSVITSVENRGNKITVFYREKDPNSEINQLCFNRKNGKIIQK